MGGMNMDGMMGMYGGRTGGSAKSEKPEMKTLTRTDFKIDFIWQPPAPGTKPRDLKEIEKELNEAAAKFKGAISLDEAKLSKASEEKSARRLEQKLNAANSQAAPGLGTPGAPTPPPTPPAPPGAPAQK